MSILQRFLSVFRSKPSPSFIAQQLRQPSGEFAREIGNNMNRVNEALYDLTLDVMQPKENDQILEIGFGTGKFFNKLFLNERKIQVSGIDYSEEMIEAAKSNNPEAIASGKLDIQWGQSDDLPFLDQKFDKVFCNMVIYFWERPENHLREIHRVLKPAGKFYTGIRSRESMLAFPFVEYGFNLFDAEEWKDILAQNGFTFVELQTKIDPPIEFNNDELQLESCCIVARRKMDSTDRKESEMM